MCAILDNSARGDVFGENRTAAGKQFFDWLEKPGRPRLMLGGKLTDELFNSRKFEEWAYEAIKDGRARNCGKNAVNEVVRELSDNWIGKSNDQHVIALAIVSKACILYAKDKALRDDFKNAELVPGSQGKLYPIRDSREAPKVRQQLLSRTDLCPNR